MSSQNTKGREVSAASLEIMPTSANSPQQDSNTSSPGFFNRFKDAISLFKPKVYHSTGPYAVGIFDYYFKPSSDFDFKSAFYFSDDEIRQDFFPSDILFRVYYPSDPQQQQSGFIDWLPEPQQLYAQGYGNFAKIPKFISNTMFGFARPYIRQPAYYSSKLIDVENIFSEATDTAERVHQKSSGEDLKNQNPPIPSNNFINQDQSDTGTSKNQSDLAFSSEINQINAQPVNNTTHKFPVAIFSHGLAGNRSTYSAICRELASHGFIIIAIEHRDGSASATYLKDQNKVLNFQDFESYRGEINKNNKNNSGFTPIEQFGDERLAFQRRKLKMRVDEVLETLNEIKRLNSLSTLDLQSQSGSLKSDNESKSETQTLNNDENMFLSLGLSGKMDIDNMVMIGHSFGGSLALHILKQNELGFSDGTKPFKAAVMLDPWMFPVDREPFTFSIPLLVLRSEHFMTWEEHYNIEMEYFKAATNKPADSLHLSRHNIFYSINLKNLNHQHFSDLFTLFPWLARIKSKTSIDPNLAISISNQIILEFLKLNYSSILQKHPNQTNILSTLGQDNLDHIIFD
ncbi:hypothetical protein BB561_000930 [Smittium simulii]|uniref:Putative phospholipase n=1 Tax=Smittium simulii TaxID=133385 RepID=A0A2T9YWW6_9FUNG|nr:hypothetical protein BB561_000930 [Smittium simulii]